MKFAVIGTGAVGGFYGGMLAAAGNEVHFLLRSDYDEVKMNGLRIVSSQLGDVYIKKVNAWKNVLEMPVVDVVLICLKTTQNKEFVPLLLPPLLKENTVVILIQNGLGVEEDVSTLFPGVQLAGGVAQIGANKTNAGVIDHYDYGNIALGNYSVRNMQVLEHIASLMNAAKVPATATQDLKMLRWKKLVWNMSLNGLSVVYKQTTDKLLAHTGTRALTLQLMLEVVAAANACGVLIEKSYAEDMLAFTDKMSAYSPSMKLDYEYGRPLELTYIYQKPLEAARKNGVLMPETEKLYQQLLRIIAE